MDRKLLLATLSLACVASCLARPKWTDSRPQQHHGPQVGPQVGPQRAWGSHGLTWTSDKASSGSAGGQGWSSGVDHPWDSASDHAQISRAASGQNSGIVYGQNSGTTYGQNSGTTFGQSNGTAHGQNSGTAYGQNRGTTYGQISGSNHGQISGSNHGQISGSNHGQISGSNHGQISGGPYGQNGGSTLSRHHDDQVVSDSTWGSTSGMGRAGWSPRGAHASPDHGQVDSWGRDRAMQGPEQGGQGRDGDRWQWDWDSPPHAQQHPAGHSSWQGAAQHHAERDEYGRREY